jgi:plasmid stabilization system protein ParE
MTVEILQEAEDELNEAIAYYEDAGAGLGQRLKEEVRAAISWIQSNPELPRVRPRGYRRVNLRVFPYYIAYFIWGDAVWILAVAHGRRRPEYWMERRRKTGKMGEPGR